MSRIATITLNPAIDLTADAPRVVPTAKLRCTEPSAQAGGGGINVARVAARFGHECLAIHTAGGANGQHLAVLLAQEPFEAHPIPVAGETRQSVTINDARTHEQYRFVFPGPAIGPRDEEAVRAALTEHLRIPAAIVVSGSLPRGASEGFVESLRPIASEVGALLVVDGPAAVLRTCRGAGLIKPNHVELNELCGAELTGVEARVSASRSLIEQGVSDAILLSLGEDGAILVERDRAVAFSAPKVELVSAVGAGDSMVGGLVGALAEGGDLVEAAAQGVAAGAAAILTPGTDLCRPEDARRLRQEVQITDLHI